MARPSGNVRSSKAERTRKKIEESFVDLMSRKKWDKITVKEICDNCSITRSTFYQYYSDIYELMEALEDVLLDELAAEYRKVITTRFARIPDQSFIDRFDYCPPGVFYAWFRFVEKNRTTLFALLDRNKGDLYFVTKLKQIMVSFLNESMDADGIPNDELRSHFVKLFMEMHILAAQLWIEDDSDITIYDIINLLNTMRVGACFLNFKSRTDPDYENYMNDLK